MKQRPSFFVAFRQSDGRMDPPSRQIFRRYSVHKAVEMVVFLHVVKTFSFREKCLSSVPYACTFCRDDALIQFTFLPRRRLFICYILCCLSRVNQKTPLSNRRILNSFNSLAKFKFAYVRVSTRAGICSRFVVLQVPVLVTKAKQYSTGTLNLFTGTATSNLISVVFYF